MERVRYFEFDWIAKLKKLSIPQILGASLFIGLLAQIRIPLYFTPVPITGQTLAVMLIGALLGSRKGSIAVICYLVQGCLGMPVWAGGGIDLMRLAGPTGGYLIGFVVQAYLTGFLFEQKSFTRLPAFLKIVIASALQLALGALWLSSFTGWSSALMLGFYPFILGEILKAGITASYLKLHEKHFSLS